MNRPWNDARVLVVGGAGFVGSNLIRKLLDENVYQVTIVDNLLSSEAENIPESERVDFWEGSISDDRILHGIEDEYDYIFHLATYHGNQSSIYDPLADHENSLLTTLKLLNHVRDFKRIRKVVYSGAGCAVAKKTFDKAEATSEDALVSFDMDSPYSISKIVGEFYATYFHRQHGLPTVRARFQNVYGPREVLGAGKWRGTPATVWRNVTPTFIFKALKGKPLPLENEGMATRDFIYVEDIVQGLMLCAQRGEPGDVYNIASGAGTSIKDLADLINRLTGNETPPDVISKRDWDRSGNRFGSTAKAKEKLGFAALVRLEEGLKRTIEWTMSQMEFIEKTMSKHQRFMSAL
jgi:UDP-glucose 4-epimerase